MRISDLSSDVCSSDLSRLLERSAGAARRRLADAGAILRAPTVRASRIHQVRPDTVPLRRLLAHPWCCDYFLFEAGAPPQDMVERYRSEERRVGKECVSTCRSSG